MRITVRAVILFVIVALGATWAVMGYRKSPPHAATLGKGNDVYSLVLLLKAPRTLTAASVAAAGEKAFGVRHQVTTTPHPEALAVLMPTAQLGVIYVGRPYLSPDQIAAAADRERVFAVKHAWQVHKAWVSVDWAGPLPDGGETAAYQQIGKLTAAMLGDDVLALYCPTSGKGHAFTPSDGAVLQSQNPLSLFDLEPQDKVEIVSAELDEQLAGAAAEARRRWPEFVAAFKSKRPQQGFAVKKCFQDGDGVEHMWVEISTISGTTLTGKLVNVPEIVHNIRMDDPVTLSFDEIEDWIYSEGRSMVGGFSAKILDQQK